MTDNKAPERITAWVNKDGSTQFAGDKLFPSNAEVEYVRADLHPVVKPLEWNKAAEDLDCDICDTFGMYQIADEDYVVLFVGHSSEGQIYETVEAAKAAAQADFVSRMTLHLDLAPMTDTSKDLPPVVMIWRSQPFVDHLGTWATTRYPEEAVAYVPKTDFERVKQAAELGLKMAEANDLWITAETIREVLAGCQSFNQKDQGDE